MKHKDLLAEAQNILERKPDLPTQYPPLKELLNEIHEEEVSTHRKLLFYKWSGLFLLLAIPLIAASVSADLITKRYASWIAPLSLLLTALTILNAALRPNQRFPLLCNIGVGIRDIKMSLLLDIVNVNTENELKKCVNQRHQELDKFSRDLIGTFLPQAAEGSVKGGQVK